MRLGLVCRARSYKTRGVATHKAKSEYPNITGAKGHQTIVSYAGWSKIEGTKASAEYLIDELNREGVPFKEVHFSRAPCGREGKSSIVSAQVIKSEGKRDKELSWIVLIDDWLRQEGIESILPRHRPIPLRPEQVYPPHGGKQNKDCW